MQWAWQCHLWLAQLLHTFSHYYKNGAIIEVTELEKCVLIFPTTFV
jgi:hypothetical protein